MFHNVLFIVLVLCSIYFLVLAASPRKSREKIEEEYQSDDEEKGTNELPDEINSSKIHASEVLESTDEALEEDRIKYKFF